MSFLTGELRDMSLSKGELNNLRKVGKIPAVIFGKGLDSVPVFVNLVEFRKVYDENGKIFELKYGSNKETVNAKVIDTTPLGVVSHISFHQLVKGETTTVKVAVNIDGTAAGEKAGGMVQQLEDTITVHAVPKDIPESIHIDVSSLDIGDSITIADVKLPKGLTVDDADLEKIVVNCQAPQKQEEETEAAAEDAPAEAAAEAAPAGDAPETSES